MNYFFYRELLADVREPLLDASMALAFAMAVVFIFRYFTLWKLVLGKTSYNNLDEIVIN